MAQTEPLIWSDQNFVSGSLCLDLANTVSGWLEGKRYDRLGDYGDFLRWLEAGNVIDSATSNWLYKNAKHGPAKREAVQLRSLVTEIFYAHVREQKAKISNIAALNHVITRTAGQRELSIEANIYAWRWSTDTPSLDLPLGKIAHSAASLLVGDELHRIKICPGSDCNWFFVDRTKNFSRRWCDMAVCGNRAKARRFQQTSRSADD